MKKFSILIAGLILAIGTLQASADPKLTDAERAKMLEYMKRDAMEKLGPVDPNAPIHLGFAPLGSAGVKDSPCKPGYRFEPVKKAEVKNGTYVRGTCKYTGS